MRKLMAAFALTATACGGGGETAGEAEAATPAATAAAPTAEAGTGTLHEVRMVLADGNYEFVPSQLTIKVGDRVRWIMESGAPHNVQFYADQIPDGAAAVLETAMPDQMTPLNGPFLTQVNETYEISFVGAPVGSYGYVCTPHEMLGMTATLTVEE